MKNGYSKDGLSMNEKKLAANRQFLMLPIDLDGVAELIELALDLRWSWNRRTDKLWEMIDPDLWKLMKNPWNILKTVSREKLKKLLSDPMFLTMLKDLVKANREDDENPGWFQKNHGESPLKTIAYFSMEYMLSEAFPIYSGGLGNVAGDQLKASSDLGVPVVAVGLLYQQGYFRQFIDKDGVQQALYPYNDPGQLPITPLRRPNGEWLRLKVEFPGWSLWIRTWHVEVGRTTLLLLDSNDSVNPPFHRGITSELYGGGSELRLKQELLLGIGGWMLLEELGIKPDVCHLNEGHAALAVLERAASYMKETGESFETALAITRAGNLFTTHTAVPAGFDRFSPDLIEQYLGKYAQTKLGISFNELMALGRLNSNDADEPFNMAHLAIHGSGAVNGVSLLHGKISRHIFQSLFPKWPKEDIPVGYVTNGVHIPSWNSSISDQVWAEACGPDRWLGEMKKMEEQIRALPDLKIWQMRAAQRKELVKYIRQRLGKDWAASGNPSHEIEQTCYIFDPNILTLGFARRFATYKRPNMLLHDPERLIRILTNTRSPVQLVLGGKAHPADIPGKNLILEWQHFLKLPEVQGRVVFLSDYDVLVAEHLVSGVDVWINTPRRPWEACGTSGMKILVNGGLNLSELDGWWAEAYSPEVGWAIGDGEEHGDDPAWDAAEANMLYDLLENEVIPQFYQRDDEGIPTAWVARIRESMAQLTPHYSANRSVREYTEKYYLPAAANYLQRSANNSFFGKKIIEWNRQLKEKWHSLRFVDVKWNQKNDQYDFEVIVYLDDLNPDSVVLQIYAEKDPERGPIEQPMTQIKQLEGDPCMYVYQGSVPNIHPVEYYTVRIVPYFDNVAVPLENDHILWHH